MKQFILLTFLLGYINLSAQSSWGQILEMKVPAEERISGDLWQIAKLYEFDQKAALAKLPSKYYQQHEGNLILEITTKHAPGHFVSKKYLESLGIKVDVAHRHTAEVHIPVNKLLYYARKLEHPYLIKSYLDNTIDSEKGFAKNKSFYNEGPGLTNISTYNNNGKNGQGIKIGVIDPNWPGLTAVANAGLAPSAFTSYNYTTNAFETGNTNHGVGCLEMIFDYAPGATYYLYKTNSNADVQTAVDQAIIDGVDILTRSSTNFNQGYDDGSGDINAAVKDATDAGIIWLNGSGNFNLEHYRNSWFDNDGDNIFNFSSTDERNDFRVAPGATINVQMQWDGPADSNNDYDIEIYSLSGDIRVASGTSTNSYESFTFTNNSNTNFPLYIEVKNMGTNTVPFQFFIRSLNNNNGLEYWTDGSVGSPANSLEDRAITIGVVSWLDYQDANPALEPYCSKGPTNNGLIVPDIAIMDSCTAQSYPNGFTGASAGGPNLAGFLAAFWSEHSYLSQDELLEVVFKLASNYKDWGAPGKDNSYGHGGAFIPAYLNKTKFIYKALNNVNSDSDGPFISILQADDLVDQNSNLYFLGETFNISPVGSTVVDKPNVYRSAGKDTFIKQ